MQPWAFYLAFVGTFISMVCWTYFVLREYVPSNPMNLSELASLKPAALRYYRTVLWICGPLFAITFFGFIIPRISHPLAIGIVGSCIFLPEILIGFYPVKIRKISAHDYIAAVMGAAMITVAYLFAAYLTPYYSHIELVFAVIMSILGVFFILGKRRHVQFELPIIYLSHFSILVAALALR